MVKTMTAFYLSTIAGQVSRSVSARTKVKNMVRHAINLAELHEQEVSVKDFVRVKKLDSLNASLNLLVIVGNQVADLDCATLLSAIQTWALAHKTCIQEAAPRELARI